MMQALSNIFSIIFGGASSSASGSGGGGEDLPHFTIIF